MGSGKRLIQRLSHAIFGIRSAEIASALRRAQGAAKRSTAFCEPLEQRTLLSVPPLTSVGNGAGGAFFEPSINPSNGSEIYVATDQTDEYHTTNQGTSWTVVPFKQLQGSHTASVQFTDNPNLLFAPGYNQAPEESNDGGQTWTIIPHNPSQEATSFIVDYNNPSDFFVSSYNKVYFTNNGGTSYSTVYSNVNGAFVAGAVFNGTTIYLGTDQGIMTSTDNGATFSAAAAVGIDLAHNQIFSFAGSTAGGVTRLFAVTVTSGNAYPGQEGVAVYGSYTGVYSMTVGSGNWALATTGLAAGDDPAFVVTPQNDINDVYLGGGSLTTGAPIVYKSSNGGANWTSVFLTNNNQNIQTGWQGTGGHKDWTFGQAAEGLTVSGSNPNEVMLTDEGAAYLTTTGGISWNATYVAPASLNAAGHTIPAGKSYVGNGMENTSSWWLTFTNANNLFSGFTDKLAIRSTDAGTSWSFNYSGIASKWNTIYQTVVQPGTGDLFAAASTIHDMYQWQRYWSGNAIDAGDGAVLVSPDQGATWTQLHDFGHPVVWEAINPNNADQMYVSVANQNGTGSAGGIYVTNDLQDGVSATWTLLPAPPRTEGFPFNIVVLNDGTLVVSYAGNLNSGGTFDASSGVFTSTNGGQTWTDTTASYPGMQYFDRDITVDPADPTQNTWFVGVWFGNAQQYSPPGPGGGLYKTTNRGQTWTLLPGSLTMNQVTQVAFDPLNYNNMYITTGTNGLWYSSNAQSTTPTFTQVTAYPFFAPERVFFNPYNPSEVWITSFGYSLVYGTTSQLGTASQLVFVQQPTTTPASTPITPAVTVDVEDANGNIVRTDNSTVTMSLNSGPGTLGGTLTAQAVNGVATFSNLTLSSTGLVSLDATDGTLTNAVSNSFTITAAPASKLAFLQQPTNATAGNVITPAITVAVEDINGNIITSNNSSVTLSINSGPGTLAGTLTVAAVNGVATFNNVYSNTAGQITLKAVDGSLTSAISSSFTLAAGAATKLGFVQQPTNVGTNTPITPAVTVGVEDALGNVVTNDNSIVTMSLNSGPGALGGTVTVQAVNGVATFNNLTLSAAGNITLKASDGALTNAVSNSFTVVAVYSYSFSNLTNFSGANGNKPEGTLVEDASGNLYGTTYAGGSSSDGTVFEVAAGTHVLTTLATFTGANGANPEAGLAIDSSGNLYGTTNAGGSSNDGIVFEVAAGTHALSTLVTFTGANGANPEASLIFDASGNLYGTTNAGGASSDGTVFEVAAGTHVLTTLATFTGTNGANPQAALTFDSSGNLYGTTYNGGSGSRGTAFEVATGTHALTTLASFSYAIGTNPMGSLALDSSGNLYGTTLFGATSNDGTLFELAAGTRALTTLITFAGTNGTDPSGNLLFSNGNLFGTTQRGGANNSGTVFQVALATDTLATSETFSYAIGSLPVGLFADAGGNLFGVTEAGGSGGDGTVYQLAPTAQPASKLAFVQQPTNVAAGSAISPAITVAIEDANGNIMTTNNSSVTISIASGPGTLGGTLTVAAVNGIATFNNLTLTTVGQVTLAASDGALTNAVSGSFTVTPGAAAKLVYVQQPTNVSAGSAITPAVTVAVEDSNGNVVTSNNSSVTIAISSGPGTLGGTTTVAAVNGVATFNNLTLSTVGSITLAATDGSLTNAVSSAFTVSPGAAAKLAYVQQPTNVNAGSAITPAVTVAVEDANGNVVTSDGSTVTVSIASGPGTLGGTLSVAAVNGVATFNNLTLTTVGSVTLNATDGSLTSTVSGAFTVSPGAAAKLAYIQQPTNVSAGSVITPAVTIAVEDANGNIVTSNSSSVTVAINSGPGTLGGTLTVAAASGVATFNNLTLTTVGSVTLNATDGSLANSVSSAITVSPGAAAKLAFIQQPTNVNAGSSITPAVTVAVEDANGNVVTSNSSSVTMAINSGPGTLSGTLTVAAVNGVATFSNLSLNTAGNVTLKATDGALTNTISNSFTVAAVSYTFSNLTNFSGANGNKPEGALVEDASGNLYGTTYAGGSSSDGTVFEVAAGTHALTTLATFTGTNGANPEAGLAIDSSGNLYGTTNVGGASSDGIVFEVAAGSHALSTLVTFTGANGANPEASLIFDASGNLYGTTEAGGASSKGTVFEVASGTHTLTTLATFTGTTTGANPEAPLVFDSSGNLYGTTFAGGASNGGVAYEVASGTHALSVLQNFSYSVGDEPLGGLTIDASGNLYGTTQFGLANNEGDIFEIAAGTHAYSILVTFNGSNGSDATGNLILYGGSLFGTTTHGTGNNGTVFQLVLATDTFTTLQTFNYTNGSAPTGLYMDASGNLFGVTESGGSGNDGTVYELIA